MKVLVNGGINLSELDGWWAEAYTPEIGWALGDGREHGDDPAWDVAEADALYDLLEREVVPEFYARDGSGISTAWVQRMRESMAQLTPHFSTHRTVHEYTEQHYIPAAAAFRARVANNGTIGMSMLERHDNLERNWPALRFGDLTVETHGEQYGFEVQVVLGDIDPSAVRIELCAERTVQRDAVRQDMKRVTALADSSGHHLYAATVPATRLASDYTPRVIAHYDGAAIPLEDARILWQR